MATWAILVGSTLQSPFEVVTAKTRIVGTDAQDRLWVAIAEWMLGRECNRLIKCKPNKGA